MTTERAAYPSEEADKYIVRFPPGMRDQLKESAKANGRTMNAEIVARLLSTFSTTPSFVTSSEPWELAAAKARGTLDPLEEQFQRARAELEAASPNAMAKRMVEEMRERERAELEKMIAAAVGPTIEEQVKRIMEQELESQRRLLEQVRKGLPSDVFNNKPPKK